MGALLFVNKTEVDMIVDAEMRTKNTPWARATGTNMKMWVQLLSGPKFYMLPPDADIVGDPKTNGLIEVTIQLDIDKASKYVQEGILPLSVMRAWGMDPTDTFSYKEPKKGLSNLDFEDEFGAKFGIEDTYGFGILTEAQSIEVAKNVKVPQGFNLPKKVPVPPEITAGFTRDQILSVFKSAASAPKGAIMTFLGMAVMIPGQGMKGYLKTPEGSLYLEDILKVFDDNANKFEAPLPGNIDPFTGLAVGKAPKMEGSAIKSGPIAQAGLELAARLKKFADEEGVRQQEALAQALMDVTLDPYVAREV